MWIHRISSYVLAVADLYILIHLAHSQETAQVPPTPQIHQLTSNLISDTLVLEWYDGGSAFKHEIDATWQIQILRKQPMEEVALETYQSKLTGHNELLRVTWRSQVPFNCTTHYVRIRCQLRGNGFDGSSWSKWSEVASIPGKDDGSTTKMYPIDRAVQVGSNVTFCCVWNNKQRLESVAYADCPDFVCRNASLSEQSILIHMDNVKVSMSSGNNAWCLIQEVPGPGFAAIGTVLFVGYPPDVPNNLACNKRNSKKITCEWGEGKATNLFGHYSTNYFLTERLSGQNITCEGGTEREHYQCDFPILNDQTRYSFTVQAFNNLGQSEASFDMEV